MDTRLIAPIALFAVGIIAIFISGGDKMFLFAGAALVFVSGLVFMKFM